MPKGLKGFQKGNQIGKGNTYGFKKGHIPWNKGKEYLQISGKNNPNWKGGKKKSRDYWYILKPNHPRANKQGYVKRANLVMEKMIGRFLEIDEVVHHKGIKYPIDSIKNKQDDRPKNLQLFNNHSEHLKFHRELRKI